MSDLWKQCEGLYADNQFPLLQFLGNTNHSAVFATQLTRPDPRKAAIKFISADVPAAERQLAVWSRAAQLTHPHLLQVFQHGRCRIAGMDLLYLLMEFADENLSQFLPRRALTVEETRELLNPLVDALSYLHAEGLAHSHIKPSNLLAIADQLKLSCDTILPIGESREAHRDRDVYDAPEDSASSTITASSSADVWSLGITLVETLTQQAPSMPFEQFADPALPGTLPEPFLEVAHHLLLRDPARRWTISEISVQLNPVPLAVAAAASAISATSAPSAMAAAPAPAPAPALLSPVSIPLSTEPAVPLAKLPVPKNILPRREIRSRPESTVTLPSYAIPALLFAVLVFGAIFTLPKFFRRLPAPAVSTASTAVPSSSKPNPVAPPKSAPTAAPPKSVLQASPKTSIEPKPAPAVLHANLSTPAITAKSSVATPDRGEVLDQVLPQASPKALATIHGTVRVMVRVEVDPVGNVSSAEFDAPGPSKYFADLALRAAERWQFASPVSEGHSLPSQWLIRFEFSPTGVIAVPQQTAP